jgi:hypothetical protein
MLAKLTEIFELDIRNIYALFAIIIPNQVLLDITRQQPRNEINTEYDEDVTHL